MLLVLVIFFANDVSHNIKWHSRAEDLVTPVSSHACVCMVMHICVNRHVCACICVHRCICKIVSLGKHEFCKNMRVFSSLREGDDLGTVITGFTPLLTGSWL